MKKETRKNKENKNQMTPALISALTFDNIFTRQSRTIKPIRDFVVVIIKPDVNMTAIKHEILGLIADAGLVPSHDCSGLSNIMLSADFIDEFYAEHVGKDYHQLNKMFLMSGTATICCFKFKNKIDAFKGIYSSTATFFSNKLKPIIREKYGNVDIRRENAIHSSDTNKAAKLEFSIINKYYYPNKK